MSEQLGRYVRIEGPDGAGKTTQLQLAQDFSIEHDIPATFVREPGGTELGVEIRHMLLTNKSHDLSPMTEVLLFTADRNHLVETVILPKLEDDELVIGDRGIESTKIYQAAGGGIDPDMIQEISNRILPHRYVRPDALALLSISRSTREKRMADRYRTEGADKIEQRQAEYFDRVFEGYKSLEKEDYVTIVNAERTPEEVFYDMKPILFGKYLPRDTHKTTIV